MQLILQSYILDALRVMESLLLTQVVVASKFDNRLKEFAERWEVDRYLSATGYLHPNAKPFFVALPKVLLIHRQLLPPCCNSVYVKLS